MLPIKQFFEDVSKNVESITKASVPVGLHMKKDDGESDRYEY